ncbi:DUF1472 domain-containing protein [Nocardioides sp. SLBN-35]|uniref:DUF1472 domain-containing protein n=1 Tax=Nocardioides sp. SLBN-35 TaxID=2768445 RepID=UPI0011530932|nr:DUF1472 domain-containing protein [Nocardioides sp. SLBN-35]TQK70996.1 uncharacterized protein DUF1472 [Nocardioides sp. SLBN-35]
MLPLPRRTLVLALAVLAALLGAPAAASADDGLPGLTVGTAVRTVDPAVQEYCWTYPDVVTEQGEIGSSTCGNHSRRPAPTLRHDGALRLTFAGSGWRWSARYESTRPASPACRETRRVRRLGEHDYRVRRPAYHGTYRVTLTGRGPEGRIVAAFVWRYGTGRCS